MTSHNAPAPLRVQALLLADHIYQDEGSGKFVIAGTFHQLNVAAVPTTFERTIGVFVSLCGLMGQAAIRLEFCDAASGAVLLGTRSLDISCSDPDTPVEFAVEVPRLPLPHAGRYRLRVVAEEQVVGEMGLLVTVWGQGR